MNIADRHTEEGGEALAREAAHWFARMRGPDADASRAAFEAWLARGPEHRAAYNRASEIFAMGKLLAEPKPSVPVPAPARRHRVFAVSLVTLAACAVGIGGWVASHPSPPAPDPRQVLAVTTNHRTISTKAGEARVLRLADGSTVRLGGGSVLDVDIGSRRRRLSLLRGQARFEVAHEQRPFIVFAGGGSVTARGTIFEVAMTRSGLVDVRLLQGAVDVALPPKPASPQPPMRKLVAGQRVAFVVQADGSTTPAGSTGVKAAPPAAPREFEATPVAELVKLANRGAARPIRLADPSLGARRVSGLFRLDDTELLARRLRALFGAHMDTSDPREIVLMSTGGQAPAFGQGGGRHPEPEGGR
ncbi:FecR family protein [Sphingomonas sp. S2-65]|uniref:FecR family protein n=1 Tax=Sphingomonas sp. S2-65 TaxID=2903960 RepID=UPI001F2E666F|nr:FecR domain-containing protein [Sphingomonas sp. S2-65]UYY57173.1 FecR domain-containing protein [Sphingomonas sp. S2-65]